MTLKQTAKSLFILAFILYGIWILYLTVFPKKIYEPNQPLLKIQVVASEDAYFHFKGLDQPSYYIIKSKNYPNEFLISDEVLDLVKDNDSISNAVKQIKYGDTLSIDILLSKRNLLNSVSDNIKIIGLANKKQTLIDPSNIQKYYKKKKADNWFSLLVIGLIVIFFITRQPRTKK